MKTLYGGLPDGMLIAYVEGLIGKVFKTLPMKESNSPTLDKYIKRLLREMHGEKELICLLKNNQDFIAVMGILQHLTIENNVKNFKNDVFEAINIIERIRSTMDGGENV